MPSLDQLHKLLKAEPDDVFLNFACAMELAKLQRTEESLAQFDRVIALDPNYVAAYFHKGRTLIQSGDIAAGKAALEAGIAHAKATGDTHAAGEMSDLLSSINE